MRMNPINMGLCFLILILLLLVVLTLTRQQSRWSQDKTCQIEPYYSYSLTVENGVETTVPFTWVVYTQEANGNYISDNTTYHPGTTTYFTEADSGNGYIEVTRKGKTCKQHYSVSNGGHKTWTLTSPTHFNGLTCS